MTEAWIGLGANLGDPIATLEAALARLDHLDDCRLTAVSRFYRTPPWGDPDQPDFVNAVAALRTARSPHALLEGLQSVENELGRVRDKGRRWGPRHVDLDLLVYGDHRIDTPELSVPHPRIAERAFVLVPFASIAPMLTVPGLGRVDAMLAALDHNERAGIRPGPEPAYRPEDPSKEPDS